MDTNFTSNYFFKPETRNLNTIISHEEIPE